MVPKFPGDLHLAPGSTRIFLDFISLFSHIIPHSMAMRQFLCSSESGLFFRFIFFSYLHVYATAVLAYQTRRVPGPLELQLSAVVSLLCAGN